MHAYMRLYMYTHTNAHHCLMFSSKNKKFLYVLFHDDTEFNKMSYLWV